jgi:hypothetical protein
MSNLSFLKILGFSLLLSGAGLIHADEAPMAGTTAAPAITTAPVGGASGYQSDRVDAWQDVVHLGQIKVQADPMETSRRIVAGLKVIKSALNAKLTNDPADDNVVVCRINYDTGSHAIAHLICATNGTMRRERERLHVSWITAGITPDGGASQMLEHLNPTTGNGRFFSTKISASELQKLLLQVQCDGCANRGLVVGNN